MWASRGQAQTAADAGALAAPFRWRSTARPISPARRSRRRRWRAQNGVWGQAPDVQLTDITFPACPPGAPGLPDTCVKVDVFRNQRAGGTRCRCFSETWSA